MGFLEGDVKKTRPNLLISILVSPIPIESCTWQTRGLDLVMKLLSQSNPLDATQRYHWNLIAWNLHLVISYIHIHGDHGGTGINQKVVIDRLEAVSLNNWMTFTTRPHGNRFGRWSSTVGRNSFNGNIKIHIY